MDAPSVLAWGRALVGGNSPLPRHPQAPPPSFSKKAPPERNRELEEQQLQIQQLQQVISANLLRARATEQTLRAELQALKSAHSKKLEPNTQRRLEEALAQTKEQSEKIRKFENDEKLAGTAVVRLTEHIATMDHAVRGLQSILRAALKRLGGSAADDLAEADASEGGRADQLHDLAALVQMLVQTAEEKKLISEQEIIKQTELGLSLKNAQSRLTEQSEAIDAAHEALTKLQVERHALGVSSDELRVQLSAMSMTLQKHQKELESAHEQNHKLVQERVETQRALSELRDEMAHLRKEEGLAVHDRGHWQKHMDMARAETDSLKVQLQNLMKERIAASDKVLSLESEVRRACDKADTAAGDVARLSRNLAERDVMLHQMHQERIAWESTQRTLEAELVSVRLELGCTKDALRAVETNNQKLRESDSQLRRLKTENEQLKSLYEGERVAHEGARKDAEYFRLILCESRTVLPKPVHDDDIVSLLRDHTNLRQDAAKLRLDLQGLTKQQMNPNIRRVPQTTATVPVMPQPNPDSLAVQKLCDEVRELKGTLTSVMARGLSPTDRSLNISEQPSSGYAGRFHSWT